MTYTGTGSATTVGHGLGATPKLVIVKEGLPKLHKQTGTLIE